MRAKGYAATEPKVVDVKTAAKNSSFAIGTKLSGDYIESLETEDLKEAAHQINRRTEFQVIATNYQPRK